MSALRIAVVVGSIRKDSYNRRFAEALARLAPAGVEFNFLRIDDLPHYNQDDDNDNAPEVKRFKAEVEAADGVLFVTPEYNRSFSGVLKNAIDWLSRPPSDMARVFAGRIRLEQVLVNLLQNALDAVRDVPGPRIVITVTAGPPLMRAVALYL